MGRLGNSLKFIELASGIGEGRDHRKPNSGDVLLLVQPTCPMLSDTELSST